ncbi:uncharacterized protein G2W53_035286 [Senna tora]|uniref:Uncharacterized protein n=1 Tax=Senna tora TaxID=362788 RepID=A0A834SSJ9_9FABA|nr:uncharacterized protein G2W53_035286 [Senna tora]
MQLQIEINNEICSLTTDEQRVRGLEKELNIIPKEEDLIGDNEPKLIG